MIFDPEKIKKTTENEEEERVEKVKNEVRAAFVKTEMDIEKQCPEIFGRIVEMHMENNSHFSDAVEIMCMIDNLWDVIHGQDVSKKEIILSALLHDIGKDGPWKASVLVRETIRQLYRKDLEEVCGSVDARDEIIEVVVKKVYPMDYALRLKVLEKYGIDTSKEMKDFFRMHADWTFDVLNHNINQQINKNVVIVASTHHILEGINPAHVNEDEIPKAAVILEIINKYHFLTLVDKYQAFRSRAGMDHETAVEKLKEKIKNSRIGEEKKNEYYEMADLILASKDVLEEARKKAGGILNAE